MFLSDDTSLRVEDQSDTSEFLGYILYENFDNASTMSIVYKKIANTGGLSMSSVCSGAKDHFLLGSSFGRIGYIS